MNQTGCAALGGQFRWAAKATTRQECEAHGQACFASCSPDGQVHRNTSDGCWTRCFYDTALGPHSNATAYPSNGTVKAGMDGQVIVDAWVAGVQNCPSV